jgi:hypothetical protein
MPALVAEKARRRSVARGRRSPVYDVFYLRRFQDIEVAVIPSVAASTALSRNRVGVWSTVGLQALAWGVILIGVARTVGGIDRAAYRVDFAHYYLSANILLDGDNPYTTPLKPLCAQLGVEYNPLIPIGSNPPLLICLVSTIAWLPIPIAYAVWLCLQIAAFWALLVAVRRLLELERNDVRWLLLVGVSLNTTCVLINFHYSQVQIMVAACLAAALLLHQENRRPASCAVAMFAAALKIYPAALLPWFLLANLQGWHDFLRRGLAMAGVGAVVLAVTGVEAWRSFIVDGLPVIKLSLEGILTNYSLPSFVRIIARELWGWPLPAGTAVAVAWISKALTAGALAAAYLIVWRRRLDPIAAIGLLTAAMMISSLVCWTHYFALMLLPIAWLWREALPPRAVPTKWLVLIAGTLCLWPELDWGTPLYRGVPRMLLHFYPLAALGFIALLLASSSTGARARSTGG